MVITSLFSTNMNIIINNFGTLVAVENGMLVVKTIDGKQTFDPRVVKSIQISKGAQITSDAALLAINHNIDVYFLDNSGKPLGRIWSTKFGSITTIRRKQIDFTFSPKAVDWIKEIICEKFDNQIALLLAFESPTEQIEKMKEKTIHKIKVYKHYINQIKAQTVAEVAQTLRGWEGAATRRYFSFLNEIVPEKYKFAERSQHHAKDVFNALLNYGYGILYSKIEAELIKAGIDPYVGVLHREDYNRPVLTFDVIEKFRVWVDYVVMQLVLNDAISEECYSVREDGSVWLENLGKRILIQSLYDYLEEKPHYENPTHSRIYKITLFAQQMAQMFLNFSEN